MFEMQLIPPRRSATFIFSATLHVALGLFLVVPPLWAVQEPVDPVERITAVQVELPKMRDEEPIRIPARRHASAPHQGAAPAAAGPVHAQKHVEPLSGVIPDLPPVDAAPANDSDGAEETFGADREGLPGSGKGQNGTGTEVVTEAGNGTIYRADAPEVVPPVALVTTEPVYPEAARRARLQGDVILEAVIDRDGHVREIRVLKGVNALLDHAATNAVSTWRYRPALIGSRGVAVYLTVKVSFHLQ
ncbi:MAG: energy transducer TonB [Thermoanaerobaculia bacterium]